MVGLSCFTLTFNSSPIKGEGDSVGWFGLLYARHLTSGLRVKSAMTGMSCPASPALWIPACAGMTVRGARNDGRF